MPTLNPGSPLHADPKSETRSGTFYVPRDEEFSEVKNRSFVIKIAEEVFNAILPLLESVLSATDRVFSSFTTIDQLYDQEAPVTKLKNSGSLRSSVARSVSAVSDAIDEIIQFETPEMLRSKKKNKLHIPTSYFLYQKLKSF